MGNEYLGESISLVVSACWTITALCAEVASKRIGAIPFNVFRMVLSVILLSVTLWVVTGVPYPTGSDGNTWLWLSLSGLVGYVFGDYCLFNAYIYITARFGQLFMTIAPLAAALAGWALLDEHLSLQVIAGMFITLTGIGISVFNRSEGESKRKISLKLPMKGVLLGIGAGIGQGVGLVLSKIGMEHYHASMAGTPMAEHSMMMPFASTLIRAITGLIFFYFIMRMEGTSSNLKRLMTDRGALWNALGATVTGPFVGVSLSLMAVLYTASGIAQTLMALTPILILLPAKWIFKTHITPLEIIGAVISVFGVTLFFI